VNFLLAYDVVGHQDVVESCSGHVFSIAKFLADYPFRSRCNLHFGDFWILVAFRVSTKSDAEILAVIGHIVDVLFKYIDVDYD
jgi:hypothetical protein